MGFDGSSIKKRQAKQQGDGQQDLKARQKAEPAALSSSAWFDFFDWKIAISLLFGILLILLMFTPLLTGMFKLGEAKQKERVFEQAAEMRADSVQQSFSGLVLEDPRLLQCIKDASSARSNVSPGDTGGIDTFSQLPMLTCMDMNIISLQGISSLRELTYLNLDGNTIGDIFELQNLPKLETLSLLGNPVRNISTLRQMKTLRKVVLPDLPEVYCFEIVNSVANVQSNVNEIACRGKWSTEIKDISDRKVAGRALTDEEERLLYDYQHNQAFMPQR